MHSLKVTRLVAVAATLTGFGVLAGCGDSTPAAPTAASTPTVAALSVDEYRTKVDAICTATDAKTDALAEPTAATFASFIEQGLTATIEQREAIRAIVPPAELAETHGKIVAGLTTVTAKFQTVLDKAKAGTPAAEVLDKATTEEIDAVEKDLDALAVTAGLKVCGKD